MKIYFDSKKGACDFRPADCIAEIDGSVWSIYSRTRPGIEWDIIDNNFVPLITPLEIERPIMDERRKLERKILYEQTEIHLTRLDEQFINEDIPEEEYVARRKLIMAYRKDVRATVEQPNYPFDVLYSEFPEV